MFAGLLAGGIGGILQGVIGVVGDVAKRHYDLKELDMLNAHETNMAELQIKATEKTEATRLVGAQVDAESAAFIASYKHDNRLGGKNLPQWVNVLRATVRPFLTYFATAVYFGFVGYMLYIGEYEFTLMTAVIALGDLVSAAWSFWFVGREAQKRLTPIVQHAFPTEQASK